MAQGGGILTIKVGNSIPWKNNYINYKSKYDYAHSFFIKQLLIKFFGSFFVRGLTYKTKFIRLSNLLSFLKFYQTLYKVDEGRKLFSCFPITGVFLSQLWINYVRDWIVISVTIYRVQRYIKNKIMIHQLWRLRGLYDSFIKFDFTF